MLGARPCGWEYPDGGAGRDPSRGDVLFSTLDIGIEHLTAGNHGDTRGGVVDRDQAGNDAAAHNVKKAAALNQITCRGRRRDALGGPGDAGNFDAAAARCRGTADLRSVEKQQRAAAEYGGVADGAAGDRPAKQSPASHYLARVRGFVLENADFEIF